MSLPDVAGRHLLKASPTRQSLSGIFGFMQTIILIIELFIIMVQRGQVLSKAPGRTKSTFP